MKIGFNRTQDNCHALLRCPTICKDLWCFNRSMLTTWLEWLTDIHKLLQTDASRHKYKQFGEETNDFLRVIASFYLFCVEKILFRLMLWRWNKSHLYLEMPPKITRGKKGKDKAVVPYDPEPVQQESTTMRKLMTDD